MPTKSLDYDYDYMDLSILVMIGVIFLYACKFQIPVSVTRISPHPCFGETWFCNLENSGYGMLYFLSWILTPIIKMATLSQQSRL